MNTRSIRRLTFRPTALALVVLALLLLAAPVSAQGEEPPAYGFPAWFDNLAVAGLALAPIATLIVQIVKAIGARLGLPEGYSGYITGIVVVVLCVIAVAAGVFQVETQVADALATVQRVAEAMLMLLAAFGWYEVGKRAQIFKPVRWKAS